MQAEDVYKNYRAYKVRLEFLTEKAKEINQAIILMRHNILADNLRLSPCLNGTIQKTTYGNPTENIAVMMADGTTPEIQMQQKKLQELRTEMVALSRKIHYADISLEALNVKERFVIKAHMIDGYTWEETYEKFEKEFPYPYTIDGLRKLQKKALEKLKSILSD